MLSGYLTTNFVEESAKADGRSNGVPGSHQTILGNENRELGKVGNVDPLHWLVEDVGNQHFVVFVEARNPLWESASMVVGAENDSGSDDGQVFGKGLFQNFFAPDL